MNEGRMKEVLAIAQSSGMNAAVDKTYDLGNIDSASPLILQFCTPTGAISGLIITDADTGQVFLNIGLGGNYVVVLNFLPDDRVFAFYGLAGPNPPGGATYGPLGSRRPRHLRIQIGALGVGLQSYWEFFGEYASDYN